MTTTLLLLLALPGTLLQQAPPPPAPPPPAAGTAAGPGTEDEVRAAEKALADLPAAQRYRAVSKVAEAWQRLRRPDDAVRVWEGARDRVAPEDSAWVVFSLGAACERAGRRDDAIRILEPLASLADGTEPGSAHVRVEHSAASLLAGILERAGRYREALAFLGKWRPNGGCGTCRAGEETSRQVALGRCRMGLDDWDGAIATWNRLLVGGDGLSRSADPVVGLLIEHGVRRGRIDEVRKMVSKWDEDARRMHARLHPVGDAFAAKDAERFVGLVTAAREYPWPERHMAERMLRDLGKPAVDALIARIVMGEAEAATVAALAKVPEALPAIRLRLEVEEDPKVIEALRWSMDALGAR